MKPFNFSGKTVLITGASMGIGEVFARELSRRGASLIIVARSEAKLKALAAQLGKAAVITADLTRPGETKRVFDEVAARHLSVDVLINNAGFGVHGEFDALPLSNHREQIDLNVNALVEMTHLFLPMIEQRQGGVIQLASMAAYQPCPYFAVYGATKAFVLSFGEALWAEYRPRGVRVLTVSPGATDTPFFQRSGEAASPGKKARPEDVVKVALAAFDAGRSSVIEGTGNNVAAFASRFLSRAFAARFIANLAQRRTRELAAGH